MPATFDPDRLRTLRRDAGLSRTQLAARLGRAEFTIGRWERGKTAPGYRDIIPLTQALGCTRDELFGRSEALGDAS